MVVFGPRATSGGQSRQARKGAAVTVQSSAAVRLRPPPIRFCASQRNRSHPYHLVRVKFANHELF
jgi:hypothetical protein